MPQTRTAIAPPRDPLTVSDRAVIAQVLTWDCQREVVPEEIETIAIKHDILWVKLTEGRSVPIAVDTFRTIRRQQLEQKARQLADAEVALVMAIEAKIQAVAESEPVVEVDQADRSLYRVWQGYSLLGTFYQCQNYWVAEPVGGRRRRYQSADACTAAISHHSTEANYLRGRGAA